MKFRDLESRRIACKNMRDIGEPRKGIQDTKHAGYIVQALNSLFENDWDKLTENIDRAKGVYSDQMALLDETKGKTLVFQGVQTLFKQREYKTIVGFVNKILCELDALVLINEYRK